MAGRLFFILVIIAAGAAAYALREGYVSAPDRWNPFAPFTIEEPLNWLTRFKLERATREGDVCRALLEQAPMRYSRVEDRETAPGCGFTDAVRISKTTADVGEPFTLSCRSAVALALWERHILQPAAQKHFDARVTRLEHYGSFACRNIYGRENAPISRHATADALDLAGFVMESGRRVRVDSHWGDDGAAGAFLREIHEGACRVFDAVLGPDYNAAHRDHFHFDRGGWRACR